MALPAQISALVATPTLVGPAYQDLARRLRLQIVDGRIAQGVRMPSERALAAALGLSRSTVTAAYATLAVSGFLQPRTGSGSYVTLPRGAYRRPTTKPDRSSDAISLTCASMSAPGGLAGAFETAASGLPELLAQDGYLPDGLPQLRERIADWFVARGLPTEPEQIIVTGGALAAFNIVLRTMVGAGDRVVMEAPTYPAAIDAVRRSGARPVAYPLGAEGWQPDDFDLLLRQTAPRLAYLIPEFHNPTGLMMSDQVRSELGQAVRRNRTIAVIDETLVELDLELDRGGRAAAPAPLATHLPDAVTIGSASKAYWGGLRIGWIRAPHDLVLALVETRAAGDLGSSVFEQLVVTELLSGSGTVLAEHRRRLREQRDHLAAEISRTFPDWEFVRPEGGLSLWLTVPAEASTQLAALAEQHGLILTAGPRFFPGGGGERRLRIPFTAAPEVLTVAIERLDALWHAVQSGRRPTGAIPPMRLTA